MLASPRPEEAGGTTTRAASSAFLAATLLLLAGGWQTAAAAPSYKPGPLAVELVPGTDASEPGAAVSAELRVRADERAFLRVSVRATGPVSPLGVRGFTLPVEAGKQAVVPIRYSVAGRGEGELRVSVRGARSAVAVLYMLATGDEVLHGRAGPLALRVEVLQRRRAAGSLSAKGFETALAAATGEGATTATVAAATPGTVSGVVRWTDSAGGVHPVRAAPVELWPAGAGDAVAVTTSGEDGSYSLPTPVAGDYLVRMIARGPGFAVRRLRTEGSDAHHVDSEARPMGPDAATGLDLTAGNVEDNATAFSVADAILTGARYTEGRHGSPPSHVDVLYPSFGTFYDPSATEVHLLQLDRFDWDVALHEYGHHVSRFLGLDETPGGSHFPGVNMSEFFGKDFGIHLAWGEGWPTFFGISLQRETGAAALGIPFVGDDTYTDTEDADFHIGLEAETELFSRSGVGEDDELSVMRILWDAYDAAEDEGDFGLALGDEQVWELLEGARTVTLSDAFQALTTGRQPAEVEQIGCVFTEHSVAPARVGPEDEALTSRQPPTFTWRANGGGPSFRNDQFVVELYDATLRRLLLASPPLTSTSYTPSRGDWRAAQDSAGGAIRWFVRGAQSAEPATGPYAGCSRGFVEAEPPPQPTPESPFEVVAELGVPAPGGGTLLDHFEVAGLNHRGEVAFVTDIDEGQSVFVARDGELREVVRTGTEVAGVTLGAGSIDQTSLNDGGETAFAWALDDSFPAPFGAGAGLFRADAHGQVDALMLPGVTPAPGGGVFRGARVAALSNDGDVAFAGLAGTSQSFGIYVARSDGSMLALARPGEPAPGGGTFGTAFAPAVGESGDVVFAATLAGVPGRGLFRSLVTGGAIEAIVRPGDPAPGGGTFRTVGRSVVNARGDVLFASTVLRPDLPLIPELYLATGDGIVPVAQLEGELTDGFLFTGLVGGLGGFGLNDLGDVAFVADAIHPSGEGGIAVYATSHGTLRRVARDGDEIPGLGFALISFSSPALIDQQSEVVFGVFTFRDGRELLLRG